MAFAPSSTIYLCNVPFDATYKNQIMFDSVNAQRSYFSSKVVKTFVEYLTVRKTLPNGSVQSSVKVKCNIDDLYNCNYMCYQNANHGEKFFYAFIVKLIYINESTTEVIFETDVFQTWMPSVDIKDSFVVREHSVTDNKGENLVPENFNIDNYHYQLLDGFDTNLGTWGYLIGTSEPINGESDHKGRKHSGIYQAMYFYYFELVDELNSFFEKADQLSDCVQFITYIPKFCLGTATVGDDGEIESTVTPAERHINYNLMYSETLFDVAEFFEGYKPKNNKLFSAPYFTLCATNHNGNEAVYEIEKFKSDSWGNFSFTMYGDISCNPSITIIPERYRGAYKNYDFGISLGGFPQCAFNADAYKLWVAKNQFSNESTVLTGTLKGIAGVAATVIGVAAMSNPVGAAGAIIGGAGAKTALAGAATAFSGAMQINKYIGSDKAADHLPNSYNAGRGNNLLSAIEQNKFHFYIRSVTKENAIAIDNYFTMFGYQTNKVKKPNLSARPYYNYVQTEGINIVGAIPNEDMITLKGIFDKGVTLWKPNATIGDYSVDNRP